MIPIIVISQKIWGYFYERIEKAVRYIYNLPNQASSKVKMGRSTISLGSRKILLKKNAEMDESFFVNWGMGEFKKLSKYQFERFLKILQPPFIPPNLLSPQD